MQSLDVVGSPLEVVSLNPTTKVLGDLPPELIREVLLRVERRVALARCSAVAMQWHALVHTEVAKEHVRTARVLDSRCAHLPMLASLLRSDGNTRIKIMCSLTFWADVEDGTFSAEEDAADTRCGLGRL